MTKTWRRTLAAALNSLTLRTAPQQPNSRLTSLSEAPAGSGPANRTHMSRRPSCETDARVKQRNETLKKEKKRNKLGRRDAERRLTLWGAGRGRSEREENLSTERDGQRLRLLKEANSCGRRDLATQVKSKRSWLEGHRTHGGDG